MSRAQGRVIHKSIDITHSAHSLTPLRKISPARSVSRTKGHTNSFTGAASQAALPRVGSKRQSPYAQGHVSPPRGRLDGQRMRASSPMIKKISSELGIGQRQPYGPLESELSRRQYVCTTDPIRAPSLLVNSASIPANLNLATESPKNKSGLALDSKLTERLKNSQRGRQFGVYAEVFQEAIQLNKSFGPLLTKIKAAYEEQISSQSEVEKLSSEVKELERTFTQEREEKQFALKKLEKFSLENLELSRCLDERENECLKLQEKLYQISQVDTKQLPTEEQAWQFLLSENHSYQELFSRMERDLTNFQNREKKLLRLLVAMKRRGYPVDDVYEEDVQKQKVKKPPAALELPSDVEDSEAEALIDGPPKRMQKPEGVPALRLSEVEPESESDSGLEVSSESSVAMDSGKKRSPEGQPHPQSLGTKSSVESQVRTVPTLQEHYE